MIKFGYGLIIGTMLVAALGYAQPTPAPVPPQVPAASTPPAVPDWVVRYAGNQEQAARACQLQLAQEQTKLETVQKELADAKSALAAAKKEK
jgi:hypothetical protein